jgi:hypothetical protein
MHIEEDIACNEDFEENMEVEPPKYISMETQTEPLNFAACPKCQTQRPLMNDVDIQVSKPDVNCNDLKNDEKQTRFFTGFSNYQTFKAVLDTYKAHGSEKLNYWDGEHSMNEKLYHKDGNQKPGPRRATDAETEFLITMMWMRLGLLLEHLGFIFKRSVSTISRIVTTWSQFMYQHNVGLVVWPTREQCLANLPIHFINHSNTYCVMDATEFRLQCPSSLEAQNVTWSEYKHSNTIKSLVGTLPCGLVTYLSKAWGGRASDRHIVKMENCLQHIPEGMAVMADKGFEVEDLAPPGVEVVIPPKVSRKGQMSDYDIFKTLDIAEPRIVIEMKMEQAKNYQLLQTVFPVSRVATAEQAIFNCFAFTNLLPPLFQPITNPDTHVNLPIYKD